MKADATGCKRNMMASSSSPACLERNPRTANLNPNTKRLAFDETNTATLPLSDPPIFNLSEYEAYNDVQMKAREVGGDTRVEGGGP